MRRRSQRSLSESRYTNWTQRGNIYSAFPTTLASALFLIEALAQDRPDDLANAWRDAEAGGPRWRERLAATLARVPATREHLIQAGVPPKRQDGGPNR